MTRTEIIAGLQEKGYDVEPYDAIKNGVVFKGIMFKSEMTEESKVNVAPIIYTDNIIEDAETTGESLGAVISKVENEYKNNRHLDFNLKNVGDRDYILNNIYIRIQRESDESLTKRKCMFDGIESYLYVRIGESERSFASMRVYDTFLESRGIEVNEAWEFAKENTNKESLLIPTREIIENALKEAFGEDAGIEEDCAVPLYVLTNTHRTYGASAILDSHLLMEFAAKFNTDKIVVLPSSIHETLLIPFENGLDIEELTAMVRQINDTEVKPEEVLGNNAYVVNPFKNWAYPVEA